MSEENNAPVASNADLCAFYGQKAGMTRIFDKNGNNVPVTVIKLIPNVITQVKTTDKDGYNAYQVAYYEKRENLLNKPTKGHLKKAKTDKNLCRFAEIKSEEVSADLLGKEISIDSFNTDTYIDVTGTTKGKGFARCYQKRMANLPWRASCSRLSNFHRTPGSIGNRATPGRVFKLKKDARSYGRQNQNCSKLESRRT
jgi:large subunit ribosomal protein L3